MNAERTWPSVSLIVSTLGVDDNLPRMIDHLRTSDYPGPIEVVVVDQSDDEHVLRACEALGDRRVAVLGSTSERGVSVGRNEGLRRATGEVLGFPDDDTWLDKSCLSRVVARLGDPTLGGVSGRQAKPDGSDSMLRWARDECDVTRTNWPRTTISSTMFLRRTVIDVVGGFDEAIGAGSPGQIGAGEETDLLLRVLAAGYRMRYDPHAVVHQDDPRDQMTPDLVPKMHRYGIGMGHLFRTHRLPVWLFGWIAGRKLVAVALLTVTRRPLARDVQLAFVRGMLTGARGVERPDRH